MRPFILIRTGLRFAARIVRRLPASPLAVIFNAPLPCLVSRKPILLPIAQRDPQHTNRSGPLAAPARPL
jgi:hypothetical protein